jgi:hypothetical protein
VQGEYGERPRTAAIDIRVTAPQVSPEPWVRLAPAFHAVGHRPGRAEGLAPQSPTACLAPSGTPCSRATCLFTRHFLWSIWGASPVPLTSGNPARAHGLFPIEPGDRDDRPLRESIGGPSPALPIVRVTRIWIIRGWPPASLGKTLALASHQQRSRANWWLPSTAVPRSGALCE